MIELKIENFKALWDWVVIRPIKIQEKGKFNRPQNEEDKAEVGEVISMGKNVPKEFIKKGDIVLFNRYSTTKIDFGNELILRAEDILLVNK